MFWVWEWKFSSNKTKHLTSYRPGGCMEVTYMNVSNTVTICAYICIRICQRSADISEERSV